MGKGDSNPYQKVLWGGNTGLVTSVVTRLLTSGPGALPGAIMHSAALITSVLKWQHPFLLWLSPNLILKVSGLPPYEIAAFSLRCWPVSHYSWSPFSSDIIHSWSTPLMVSPGNLLKNLALCFIYCPSLLFRHNSRYSRQHSAFNVSSIQHYKWVFKINIWNMWISESSVTRCCLHSVIISSGCRPSSFNRQLNIKAGHVPKVVLHSLCAGLLTHSFTGLPVWLLSTQRWL